MSYQQLRRCFARVHFANKPRILKSVSGRSFSSITPIFSHLKSPTQEDYEALASLMNHRDGCIITDEAELERYNTDWTNQYKGHSTIVVKPKSTHELSSVLSHCNQHSLGVVPQGGNTGLVGGSVPMSNEIVLSLSSINTIYSLDETNEILTCDAGCILQSLQEYAADKNHLLPIDLGAKGSCMIGGNISTNAGGQYYYRFGSLHANILGLEVVLADGQVLDLMNCNRKDNTGYHLKHLFIGAEGTLGVISKVNINCPRKPSSRHVAFLACETFDNVLQALNLAKSELGEILAAYEFMDENVLSFIENVPIRPDSTTTTANYPFCVLVETQGCNMDHDSVKMQSFLQKSMETGIVVDGTLAQDGKQIRDL